MRQYLNLDASPAGKRITLNSLKEQSYTLNMQMLLAIQSHDEKTQKQLRKKMDGLQAQMEELGLGGKLLS